MRVYLAAPYTHGDRSIENARARAINSHAARLMGGGHIVFSPISHSHQIAMENDLPTTFEFWQVQNHAFIDWADMVVVLALDGWKESRGITDEIEYAESMAKVVEIEYPVGDGTAEVQHLPERSKSKE